MLFIFDMGGVLLHNVFELVTILHEEGISTPLSDMYKDSLMYDFSAGLITEDEYWKQFNRRYNTNVSSPRWGRTFHPVRDGKWSPTSESWEKIIGLSAEPIHSMLTGRSAWTGETMPFLTGFMPLI